jgi:threonylcarbamoyladenosine tRNA methylthiotransferase MtaB
VRDRLADASFGTDLIVGFPGEDDQAFQETLRVIEEVRYANLHVFRFSPRTGTVAAGLPGRVPEAVQKDRAARIEATWAPIRRSILDEKIGKTEDVLVEGRRNGWFRGYTSDYLFASFKSCEELATGAVCSVRITAATPEGLEGVTKDRTDSD